ncbi:uncharacterized protein LOC110247599 [Exaiptasia diaphana]|uniref:EGF-like domain-containing protein n=1 Tax=Exaiptasia diaphana TaxID=2652724 RepID=A0A913XVB2_EXADI|nr:uncharacterized protein LOC110247599 [Exaiptasia diaphana]
MQSLSQSVISFFIIYVLVCYQSTAQEFVRSDRKSSVLFETDRYKKLSTNSLAVFTVRDVFECCWKCLEYHGCWSFNFAIGKLKADLFDCELFSTTKYRLPLKISNVHNHYTIKNACKSNPCANGNVCSSLDEIQYKCKCISSDIGSECKFQNEICLSGKSGQFGIFETSISGKVKFFRLVHISGGIGAWAGSGVSHWGTRNNEIEITITNDDDKMLTPPKSYVREYRFYNLPGVLANDPELILPGFEPPLEVVAGQKFKVWNIEDFFNSKEEDNHGRLCVHAYVHFE